MSTVSDTFKPRGMAIAIPAILVSPPLLIVRILLAIWRAQLSSPAEITNLCLTIVFARGLRVPPILGLVLGAGPPGFHGNAQLVMILMFC